MDRYLRPLVTLLGRRGHDPGGVPLITAEATPRNI